jgi:MFS family permease
MPSNILKIKLIYFCTRFHFYLHVYALLLQSRGLSLLEISAIESVVVASTFLTEVPTGVLADLVGRKWSVIVSVFLLMCGELQSYPAYLVVAFFTGTGFAFASGATEALIYDSLPEDDREAAMKKTMGEYGSIGQIAFFLSPLAGVFVVGDLGGERFNLAIGLTAAVLFIGVLISLTLKEPETEWKTERQTILSIFRKGIAELYSNRKLQRLALLSVVTIPFTGTLITTFAAPYLVQNNVSPAMIALTLSLGSLIAAFSQRYAYKVEQLLGERWGITVLTLLPAVSYLVLALVTTPVMSWLLVTWMYGTNDMKYPLFSAYQNKLIQTESRATTLSLLNMFSSVYVAVIAPIYALIATQSLLTAFMVIGIVIVVGAMGLRVDRLAEDLKQGT